MATSKSDYTVAAIILATGIAVALVCWATGAHAEDATAVPTHVVQYDIRAVVKDGDKVITANVYSPDHGQTKLFDTVEACQEFMTTDKEFFDNLRVFVTALGPLVDAHPDATLRISCERQDDDSI